MQKRKIRVALVGCGQIADAHLQEIRKVDIAELVAVCDSYRDLAEQAATRFGVPQVYDDLKDLLATAKPEVLHVTTPPQTHRPIALQALEAGVNVYVEKPFALNAVEAAEILDIARAKARLVCVGHDHLFDPVWQECLRFHRQGKLGRVVHIDSIQGYDLAGPFAQLFANERGHWLHRLPGGLFHNNIPHAVYKITSFLLDSRPHVIASWFGADASVDFATELRVLIKGSDVTANLVFSSAVRPVRRLARIYGTKNCLEVDLDGGLLRWDSPTRLPGPFAKLEAPIRHLREAAWSLGGNFLRFLCNDLHYFAGLNQLIRAFYCAISEDGPPPIPYEDILRVTTIMDDIFQSCRVEKPRQASLPTTFGSSTMNDSLLAARA